MTACLDPFGIHVFVGSVNVFFLRKPGWQDVVVFIAAPLSAYQYLCIIICVFVYGGSRFGLSEGENALDPYRGILLYGPPGTGKTYK